MNRIGYTELCCKTAPCEAYSCVDAAVGLSKSDVLILRRSSKVLGSCNKIGTFFEPEVLPDRLASL